MDKIVQLSKEMQQYEHIMTFSEIGQAIAQGSIAGHRSGIAGGPLIGATSALCILAGTKVLAISEDLVDRAKARKQAMKPAQ